MEFPVLPTARLTVRHLAVADALAVLDYYERNAAYLERWEPARVADFYTVERQRATISRGVQEWQSDTGGRFVAFEHGRSEIVASINLSNIRRGVNHSAIVGYSVAEQYVGRGYATEILRAIVAYAFDVMHLHRIETSYQPANHASGRVLEKAGFGIEGYARDYLYINGEWRDGVLVSRRNPNWTNASTIGDIALPQSGAQSIRRKNG